MDQLSDRLRLRSPSIARKERRKEGREEGRRRRCGVEELSGSSAKKRAYFSV
jgi:hypothetical protein